MDTTSLLVLVLLAVALGLGVFFALTRRRHSPVYVNRQGFALAGYDPVAYFAEGQAKKGEEDICHNWHGVCWCFASVENRDAFASDPTRYAPQYGGYCAWAVAKGTVAPVDPRAWHIRDGRLFLNYSRRINSKFTAAAEERIAQADRKWSDVRKRKIREAL